MLASWAQMASHGNFGGGWRVASASLRNATRPFADGASGERALSVRLLSWVPFCAQHFRSRGAKQLRS